MPPIVEGGEAEAASMGTPASGDSGDDGELSPLGVLSPPRPPPATLPARFPFVAAASASASAAETGTGIDDVRARERSVPPPAAPRCGLEMLDV